MGKHMDAPKSVRHFFPFTLPRIPVQSKVDDYLLGKMLDRIHAEWARLGKDEPYWSVLTQPQFYMESFESHREGFYASGKHMCELFLSALRRCGVSPTDLKTCLEVGCGVGRVTHSLAGAFQSVVASDISEPHLQLAGAYMRERGITNVELVQVHTLDQVNRMPYVDAIYTVITLQHNPPPVMALLLRELLSRLNPGGVAYFQLPTYKNGYIFEPERYLNSPMPETLEMHVLPQPEVFDLVSSANCVCLEVREDGMAGADDKTLSNTFLVQRL
jgi:2-polyprenyl-3-methyl-5-hydroxy-6-metoxy-1,4-benzoquinol methylase